MREGDVLWSAVVACVGAETLEVLDEGFAISVHEFADLVAFVAVFPGGKWSSRHSRRRSTSLKSIKSLIPFFQINMAIFLDVYGIEKILHYRIRR